MGRRVVTVALAAVVLGLAMVGGAYVMCGRDMGQMRAAPAYLDGMRGRS